MRYMFNQTRTQRETMTERRAKEIRHEMTEILKDQLRRPALNPQPRETELWTPPSSRPDPSTKEIEFA